ncbi:MAG: hypothetical protein HRT89_22165, partial [Lentisphaeria bacterium]|nr:hypothetical protein [Lentisphaeria bacterium]NQZ70764.1 hypothetical protein [Lentisphaeria bacterium]
PLECNYHPIHGGCRSDYAEGVANILKAGKKVYGAVGTECGFLYSVIDSDCMVQCGHDFVINLMNPEWPVSKLVDKIVPVWQLALHGLIVKENHGITWRDTMTCILFGDHPRDEWSERDTYMPELTDERINALKARYDLCLQQFGYLQTLELVSWEEPADGVQKTVFSDGTTVTADFNSEELTVDVDTILCPEALK